MITIKWHCKKNVKEKSNYIFPVITLGKLDQVSLTSFSLDNSYHVVCKHRDYTVREIFMKICDLIKNSCTNNRQVEKCKKYSLRAEVVEFCAHFSSIWNRILRIKTTEKPSLMASNCSPMRPEGNMIKKQTNGYITALFDQIKAEAFASSKHHIRYFSSLKHIKLHREYVWLCSNVPEFFALWRQISLYKAITS